MTNDTKAEPVEITEAGEVLPTIPDEKPTSIAVPTTFDGLMEIGDKLLGTKFLPSTITTPAQFAAVVMTGQELGLPTMQSLRLLQPIENKDKTGHQVSLKPEGMLALWRSRYGGRHQWLQSDDTKAVIVLIAKSGDKHTETFTAAEAKALGLIRDDKPYSSWNRQRGTMLRWRCVSRAFRFFAPEVIGGLRIEDEVEHWESNESEVEGAIERDVQIEHRERHQTVGVKGEVASGLEPKSAPQKKIFTRWLSRDCWTQDERAKWLRRAEAPEMGFHGFAKLIQELEAATNLKLSEGREPADPPPEPAATAEGGEKPAEATPEPAQGQINEEWGLVEGKPCEHGVEVGKVCRECYFDQTGHEFPEQPELDV